MRYAAYAKPWRARYDWTSHGWHVFKLSVDHESYFYWGTI